MGNERFEKAYKDALGALYLRGKEVGKPACSHDGLRYCQIDHVPLGDREVLIEAWGERLADEIIREQHDLVERGCRECDRLWEMYADTLKRYLAIFHQKRQENQQDSGLVRRAIDIRNRERKAVLDHTATHQRPPWLVNLT
jgi:hypothetical protein